MPCLKSADLDNLPHFKKVEFILPTLIIINLKKKQKKNTKTIFINLYLPAFVGFYSIQGQESMLVYICILGVDIYPIGMGFEVMLFLNGFWL